MRAYFSILVGLLLLAVWMCHDIANTVPFDRAGVIPSPDPHPAFQDNGKSACFEKRYSPDVRDCGGLLKYSMPAELPNPDKGHPDQGHKERSMAKVRSPSDRNAWQERRARHARHYDAVVADGEDAR
jgi:hypothetical protein